MKFLMTAVFLITANAGLAFGEGRYTAVAGTHEGQHSRISGSTASFILYISWRSLGL